MYHKANGGNIIQFLNENSMKTFAILLWLFSLDKLIHLFISLLMYIFYFGGGVRYYLVL